MTGTVSIPQPLTGDEIKRGIAVRMTEGLPADIAEPLRAQIIAGLSKTCSLLPSSAYAKFKASWKLHWWRVNDDLRANWWVFYWLDDFGRVTSGGIGDMRFIPPDGAKFSDGAIDEIPPDRFRRETDQPIPKPMELKKPEPEKSTISQVTRGKGKRRAV